MKLIIKDNTSSNIPHEPQVVYMYQQLLVQLQAEQVPVKHELHLEEHKYGLWIMSWCQDLALDSYTADAASSSCNAMLPQVSNQPFNKGSCISSLMTKKLLFSIK